MSQKSGDFIHKDILEQTGIHPKTPRGGQKSPDEKIIPIHLYLPLALYRHNHTIRESRSAIDVHFLSYIDNFICKSIMSYGLYREIAKLT